MFGIKSKEEKEKEMIKEIEAINSFCATHRILEIQIV